MPLFSVVVLASLGGIGIVILYVLGAYLELMGEFLPPGSTDVAKWRAAIDPESDTAAVLLSPQSLLLAGAVIVLGTVWGMLEDDPSVAMAAPSAREALVADRRLAVVRASIAAALAMPAVWVLGTHVWWWFTKTWDPGWSRPKRSRWSESSPGGARTASPSAWVRVSSRCSRPRRSA